jgi:hypothetical protein
MALADDFSVILLQMRDSSAVKLETRINGNLAPSEGICLRLLETSPTNSRQVRHKLETACLEEVAVMEPGL